MKTHFKDDYNLYHKLDLIESVSKGDARLRVGIIANHAENKSFLETYLVNPFDVRGWYSDLRNRNLSKNNLIRIGKEDQLGIQDNMDVYEIPNDSINDKIACKEIEFLEINDLEIKDTTQIDGATVLNETLSHENNNDFGCHLYIFVKSSSFEDMPQDPRLVNWPVIEVLNTHSILNSLLSCDIQTAQQANELLIESSRNSSRYLDLIMKSKLADLVENLNGRFTLEYLKNELLKIVVDQLYIQLSNEIGGKGKINAINYHRTKLQSLENLESDLESQISYWEQQSHMELQKEVTEYLNTLTNPKFSQIVRLLFKIDDLNVIYENLILTNGFMTKSDKLFNQLVGKTGVTVETNAYDSLKTEMSTIKLPELQEKIHNHVLKTFFTIPLPTIAICSGFHIFYNFEINTLMALISLLIVLSANSISKQVLRQFKNFNHWYLELCRLSIDANADLLRSQLSSTVTFQTKALNSKLDTIRQIEKSLK